MPSTLLMASEKPPTLLDIKAALLTYDRVHLLDPDDRDLFPSTGFGIALGMPPVFSMPSSNPVRRLGKTASHDDEFATLLEASKAAILQDSVVVTRTYQQPASEVTIGMVDVGGFPLDLGMLLALYRTAAADPEFQLAAVQNDNWLFSEADRILSISEVRGSADGSINETPPLSDIAFPLANEGLREPLSNIARARIGHTIKLTGFCITQGLIPHGIHQSHDAILRTLLSKSARFIDQVADIDPYWNYRNRALKLAHNEYLDLNRLNEMSIGDVLSLRTIAWGRQAEARDALFKATAELARNNVKEADFDRSVSEQIRDYRQKAAEVEDERVALRFKINCEVSKALINIAGASTAAGAIATIGTGLGAAATIAAGAYFILQQYQDLKPIAEQLRQMEGEFNSDARFGIQNFYEQFP